LTRITRDDIILIILECGCDAVVAYLLPKQTVVGSNPITRFVRESLLIPYPLVMKKRPPSIPIGRLGEQVSR
jgi:hypothetical protein